MTWDFHQCIMHAEAGICMKVSFIKIRSVEVKNSIQCERHTLQMSYLRASYYLLEI